MFNARSVILHIFGPGFIETFSCQKQRNSPGSVVPKINFSPLWFLKLRISHRLILKFMTLLFHSSEHGKWIGLNELTAAVEEAKVSHSRILGAGDGSSDGGHVRICTSLVH